LIYANQVCYQDLLFEINAPGVVVVNSMGGSDLAGRGAAARPEPIDRHRRWRTLTSRAKTADQTIDRRCRYSTRISEPGH
jgi:hypothetical protein